MLVNTTGGWDETSPAFAVDSSTDRDGKYNIWSVSGICRQEGRNLAA